MKKKEANRQSFKQTMIIVGIIIAGLAFLANIILAFVFPNCATNIFTAISGWVSGIATIILGVIAFRQNKKYKKENDRFLKEQQQLNWKLEQKDVLKVYLRNIENVFSNVKEYQYSKLINNIALNLQQDCVTIDEFVYDEILYGIMESMTYASVNSIYYFDGIEELVDLCCRYVLKLRLLLKRLPEIIKIGEVNRYNEIKELYRDLCKAFNDHIVHVRLFIDMIMTSWNYDDHDDYEDIEQTLREKRNKQKDWRKRIQKSYEEFIEEWKN